MYYLLVSSFSGYYATLMKTCSKLTATWGMYMYAMDTSHKRHDILGTVADYNTGYFKR